jgi:hypothetical protein
MIIPKEVIQKQASHRWQQSQGEFSLNDFKEGVQFAEEYLKDLAIEFTEWVVSWKDEHCYWENNTTQELFEIFIKEKYDTKTEITER